MKIGFSGTQKGMTDEQKLSFVRLIQKLKVDEFHHGDCIGADAEAHKLLNPSVKIVIHPPIDSSKRAFMVSNFITIPRGYLLRNRDIVDATEILVATPDGMTPKIRSGTWSTVRYAHTVNRETWIIYPDGWINLVAKE